MFTDYHPRTQKLLYDAFEAAWHDANIDECSPIEIVVITTKFSRAILDAAKAGERDLASLKVAALKAI